MGLLSSIGKAFKSVFKGIGKAFSAIGKFVGKITNSKWGKALLIAAAVVTGGMAIMAGVQGFSAAAATGRSRPRPGHQRLPAPFTADPRGR